MLDQRHHQLQRPRHIRDDLIVALREALDVEVGLEGLHMMDKQLGPDLGKEEGGGKAGHDTVGLAGGRLLLGPFLRLEHGLHETVHNLLASQDQLLGRLLHRLGGVVLVLLRNEEGLQQLLEPFQARITAFYNHVSDIVRLSDVIIYTK